MTRTVAQKMGVREGARAYFHEAPPSALAVMRLPRLLVVPEPQGDLDHIHLFVVTRAAMDSAFPQLAAHLAQAGQLGTDLALPAVIHIGYRHGLVESTCLSVDATWSALKFTHPLPGKTYHNSYGRLPDQEQELERNWRAPALVERLASVGNSDDGAE
jgi:hypothetical protein